MSLNDDREALPRNEWRRLRWLIVTAAGVFSDILRLSAYLGAYL